MASVGDLFVQIGADLTDFEKSMQKVEKDMRRTASVVGKQTDHLAGMIDDDMYRISDRFRRTQRDVDQFHVRPINSKELQNLPAHLKPFANELVNSQREMRKLSKMSGASFDQIQDAALKTQTSLENMTAVTGSGKHAQKVLEGIRKESHAARLAVLGLSKDGKVKISTEDSQKQLKMFRSQMTNAQRELEMLRDAGDIASYDAGMRVLNARMMEVNKTMAVVARGGRGLEKELLSMGIMTEGVGNMMAVSMERMKDSFLRSHKMMEARTNMSKKMIKNLAAMETRGLDQQFLKLTDRLETMAKRGTAAALAIEALGEGASMKELREYIMQVNQGLGRMRMLQIGLGIAMAALTYVLGKAAMGPNPSEIRQQQAEITQVYKDAVAERTQEIYNFAGLFEKVEIGKFNPATLKANLANQVKIMKDWAKNLKSLAKRGVNEGLIKELEKMGPAAAGEIKALNSMTDKELEEYVKLWEEKHQLAREKATTELEKLKQETAKKVKELEDSIRPLGEAIERFKSSWATALEPFIEQWGRGAAAVVNFMAKLGELYGQFSKAHPLLAGMIGNIGYLTGVFALLLAPMTIAIAKGKAFRAAFAATWTIIKMFTVGLASVVGTALLVATAIVTLIYSITMLWKHSEGFRDAVLGVWDQIKNAWTSAMDPVKEDFAELQTIFQNLITDLTGGADTFEGRWSAIGDVIAKMIQIVAPLIVSVLGAAFQIFATVATVAIDLVKLAVEQLTAFFETNGSTIGTTIQGIADTISTVFGIAADVISAVMPILVNTLLTGWTTVLAFIQTILPQIQNLVTFVFTVIGEVVATILPKILQIVQMVLPILAAIFQFVFPLLLAIVQMIWGNIKAVIVSALDIIINVIEFFQNILAGNWGAAWKNVVAIIKNAFILVWNAIQLIFIGKIVKGVVVGGKLIWAAIKGSFGSMKKTAISLIKGLKDGVLKFVNLLRTGLSKAWSNTKADAARLIGNMKTTLLTIFNSVKSGGLSIFNGLKTALSVIWNTIKTIASTAFKNVKNAILNPIETAKDKILGIVKLIVGAFKNMKISIPKPKLPKINVGTKKVLGVSIPTFDLQYNAKGALFKKAGMVGNQVLGEKGREVAMPVQNRRYMKPFSDAVGQHLKDQFAEQNSGQTIHNEIKVAQLVVREEADIKRVAAELDRLQRQSTRAKGGLVIA